MFKLTYKQAKYVANRRHGRKEQRVVVLIGLLTSLFIVITTVLACVRPQWFYHFK